MSDKWRHWKLFRKGLDLCANVGTQTEFRSPRASALHTMVCFDKIVSDENDSYKRLLQYPLGSGENLCFEINNMTGLDKIIYCLSKYSFLLGFIMSKNQYVCDSIF